MTRDSEATTRIILTVYHDLLRSLVYKFEEGARQGLKGVLIIHEDRGAGYPWSVVRASAQSKMYVDSDSDAYHCPLNGWIQFNAAKQLLAIMATTLTN